MIDFLEVAIKPEFIALQEEFYTSCNPLSITRIAVDEDKEESYIPSLPLSKIVLRVNKNREEEGKEDTIDITSSLLLKSVAIIDLFEGRNQDYIRFS